MTTNPQINKRREAQRDRHAFTLIELLMVLAVLVALGLLVSRSLADTRIRSTRERCASNLHQMWQALRLYADENSDSVPQTAVSSTPPSGPGTGIWDLPRNTANLVVEHGSRMDDFYCPAMDIVSRSNLWDFGGGSVGYRVIGYQWLMERNNPGTAGYDPSRPTRRLDGLPYASKLSKPITTTNTLAQVELVADIVISEGPGTVADFFERVYTSNPLLIPRGYGSSHMQGRLPEGGNILYQDGHVAFKPFSEMQRRVDWSNSRHWWW